VLFGPLVLIALGVILSFFFDIDYKGDWVLTDTGRDNLGYAVLILLMVAGAAYLDKQRKDKIDMKEK
jgi:hypothetical protein